MTTPSPEEAARTARGVDEELVERAAAVMYADLHTPTALTWERYKEKYPDNAYHRQARVALAAAGIPELREERDHLKHVHDVLQRELSISDEHISSWMRRVAKLKAEQDTAWDTAEQVREERDRLQERERSIFAWAKAARTKGSGLSASRALRWIDEMGDRIASTSVEAEQ